MEYIIVASLVGAGYYIQTQKPYIENNTRMEPRHSNFKDNVHSSNIVNNTERANLNSAKKYYSKKEDIVRSRAGNNMYKSSFTHSNMEPFFGNSVTQNVSPNANNTLLENVTGVGLYTPEKNVTPLFQPMISESISKDMASAQNIEYDRMNTSQKNRNVLPFEQIKVGKGLNEGYTNLPSDGYQPINDREFMIPKSIDELRTKNNQKITYEGRLKSGKNIIDKREQQPEMKQYLPDRDYENNPNRYFRTTGVETKPTTQSEVILRDTSKKPVCPEALTNVTSTQQKEMKNREMKYSEMHKNLFTNDGLRNCDGVGQWSDLKMGDYGYGSITPAISNITEKKTALANLVKAVKAIIAPINDVMKKTKRQTIEKNQNLYNNYKGSEKITIYMDKDSIKTTLKEELLYSDFSSNLKGPTEMYNYDPDDIVKETKKQITSNNSYIGIATSSNVKPTSHEAMENAEFNELREYLETEREPTTSNVSLPSGKDFVHPTQHGNQFLSDIDNKHFQRLPVSIRNNNDLPQKETRSRNKYKTNKLDTSVLKSLSSNPYNLSITKDCTNDSKLCVPDFNVQR